MKITITANGPYLVEGSVPLANQHIVTNDAGDSLEWREGTALPSSETYALCRCGQSSKKPFCDGAHKRTGFDGTESATREPYERQAQWFEGPTMLLEDAPALCANARFCDPKGKVWNLIKTSEYPETAKLVEHEAGHCPSGRLVAKRKPGGEALEPHHPPSLGLIQDTSENVSGPIWVRGGIPVVGADGVPYEVRNRVTLCRCGASKNKPFCDGAHASIGFKDGT